MSLIDWFGDNKEDAKGLGLAYFGIVFLALLSVFYWKLSDNNVTHLVIRRILNNG